MGDLNRRGDIEVNVVSKDSSQNALSIDSNGSISVNQDLSVENAQLLLLKTNAIEGILREILLQLKIVTIHLAEMSGEKIKKWDVAEGE